MSTLLHTNGFNEEGSYLKFTHFLTSDLKFDEINDRLPIKEGNIRVLRMVSSNVKLVEESAIPIYSEY